MSQCSIGEAEYVMGACPFCGGGAGGQDCSIQKDMDRKHPDGAWVGDWRKYTPEFLRLWWRERERMRS